MRASFPPTPLHVAVLLGWTLFGAVRERLAGLEARLRRTHRPVEVAAAARPHSRPSRQPVAMPPIRRPDYSLN